MKVGFKLYDQFKKELAALGELELAWFTTFNLQLNFFEQYILSELVGVAPKDLRNVNDYESLTRLGEAISFTKSWTHMMLLYMSSISLKNIYSL